MSGCFLLLLRSKVKGEEGYQLWEYVSTGRFIFLAFKILCCRWTQLSRAVAVTSIKKKKRNKAPRPSSAWILDSSITFDAHIPWPRLDLIHIYIYHQQQQQQQRPLKVCVAPPSSSGLTAWPSGFYFSFLPSLKIFNTKKNTTNYTTNTLFGNLNLIIRLVRTV